MTELQKEFEATGYTSWINADLYPDGKIYTQEYTRWLERQVLALRQPTVSGSVAVEDALAFAEYLSNNFDYYDCNANGHVYKWIDWKKRSQPAMTMKQIFDYWQSCSN